MSGLHVLPMMVAIILPLNMAFTLVLAVIGHHVLPGWPYISEAGNSGKARGVFSIMCNIGAFCMLGCVYFKFRHVKLWMKELNGSDKIHRVNTAALVIGLVLVFGLHTAANFQTENVPVVHRAAAFLGFLSGVLYFSLLSWIGYKLPGSTKRRKLTARTVLVVIGAIVFCTTIIPGEVSALYHRGPRYKKGWRKTDPGFGWRLTSTISEWILALDISYMFLTLVADFRQMDWLEMQVYVESRI